MNDKKIRPLFGLLIGQIEEPYLSLIWPGVTDYVEEHDIDLVIFTAKSPFLYSGYDFEHNTVNDYIKKDTLDGLIVITSEMSDYLSRDQIENIFKGFKDLPIISIGFPLDDYVSVLVDNSPGIINAVDHYINTHNYKKIGFIKGFEGIPDSEERFNAYKEALLKNGIPFDERLVFNGDFSAESGKRAADYFINEFGKGIDGIISSDDEMALGAIKTFKKRGYSIPDDISFIGFDDIEKGRYEAVPLTTVRQPLYEMGQKAAELLKDILLGKSVQKKVYLPTVLKVRQSCGCLPIPEIITSKKVSSGGSCVLNETLTVSFKEFLNSIFLDELGNDYRKLERYIPILLESLFSDFLNGEEESFFKSLKIIIDIIFDRDLDFINFRLSLFSVFKSFSIKISNPNQRIKFDRYVDVSDVLINDSMVRKYEKQRLDRDRLEWNTTDVISGFNDSIDFDLLTESILEDIPRLGLDNFYITLYQGSDHHITDENWKTPEYSDLIVAYEDNKAKVSSHNSVEFRSLDILPNSYFHSKKRRTLILMPLFFRSEQFGLLLFNFKKPEVIIYENIRTQVSSSLKVSLLFKERQEAEEELKRAFKKIEHANIQLQNISIKDELSGLYNRRGFLKIGKQEFKSVKNSGGSFVLFFFDLDGLKAINDTFGHDTGDSALKDFSDILIKLFRDRDIVSRLAGDEFTVIALNAKEKHIESIVNRLDTLIEDFNKHGSREYKISTSYGYALYNSSVDLSFEELISLADENLYIEKKKKKGIK